MSVDFPPDAGAELKISADGPVVLILGTNVPESDSGAVYEEPAVESDQGTRITTLGENNPGNISVRLTRVDSQSLAVISHSWLGSSGDDRVASMRADGDCVLVAGSTSSPDFPVTAGAWRLTLWPTRRRNCL